MANDNMDKKPVNLETRTCPVCGTSDYAEIRTVSADPWYRKRYDVETARVIRRNTCSIEFTNPVLDEATTDALYTSEDGYASNKMESAKDLYWLDQEICLHEILARLGRGKRKILDFGCGDGGLVYLGQLAGLDFHGIDLDERRIQTAIDFGVQNVAVRHSSTLEPKSFDAICCLHVLEHLRDCREIVEEFRRILRPRGMIFIMVPNGKALSFLLGRSSFWGNPYEHRSAFSRKSLDYLFINAGLKVVPLAANYSKIRQDFAYKEKMSMRVTKVLANNFSLYPTKLIRVYQQD